MAPGVPPASALNSTPSPTPRYEVGAYYFPNYHADPANEIVHGAGWTEWELVRQATPRFPGHQQPKIPLWGCEDEADPAVMARKIDAAADHGLNHFIFDWYWHDTGPYLRRCLDEGFLRAPNVERQKFALMWANHDWVDIHPARDLREPKLLYPGPVSLNTFREATQYAIDTYFNHPSYWKIDGCPYFSVYELMTLVKGLGGVSAVHDALEDFRARTRAAGLPGLHLNAVTMGVQILPTEQVIKHPAELLAATGFDSASSYVWIHHVPLSDFPATDYDATTAKAAAHWEQTVRELPLPYHPNVTMGWDSTPRLARDLPFTGKGYPNMNTLGGNTPEAFRRALERVKAFLDRQDGPHKICSINAWNEWTEGSYLEPDTVNGVGYLEAIRTVFGSGNSEVGTRK